jgi:hypothetical protein
MINKGQVWFDKVLADEAAKTKTVRFVHTDQDGLCYECQHPALGHAKGVCDVVGCKCTLLHAVSILWARLAAEKERREAAESIVDDACGSFSIHPRQRAIDYRAKYPKQPPLDGKED